MSLLRASGLTEWQIEFIKQRSGRQPKSFGEFVFQVFYMAMLLFAVFVLFSRAMEVDIPNWMLNMGSFSYFILMLFLILAGFITLFSVVTTSQYDEMIQSKDGFVKCYNIVKDVIPNMVTGFLDSVWKWVNLTAWIALIVGFILSGYPFTAICAIITQIWIRVGNKYAKSQTVKFIKSLTPERLNEVDKVEGLRQLYLE